MPRLKVQVFAGVFTLLCYAAFLIVRHPILLKLLSMRADTRVVGFPNSCSVLLGQQQASEVKCFHLESQFDWDEQAWTRPSNDVLLWIPQALNSMEPIIFIADLDSEDAGRLGNTDILNIDLLWNHALIQSKGASGYISFGNTLKFCGRDPEFLQQGQQIQFTVPDSCGDRWLGGTEIKINLGPNDLG